MVYSLDCLFSIQKQRVIGVDFSNRPIIYANGCDFPSPNNVNYDLLLECVTNVHLLYFNLIFRSCLAILDRYANRDYVVVFYSAPMEHRPSVSWMLTAYRSLSRKYKKNIKKLYVTHPSRWFRILIWFLSRILR